MKAAEFLKDEGDAFGKQDPFLQFIYEDNKYKTDVQDDAGLKASYNDVFLLENVEEQARGGKDLVVQAYDHDVASSDILGEANAISLISMCADLKSQVHKVDIFHNLKKTGSIEFESKFIYQPPDPPPHPDLNPYCLLEVIIVQATFLKDADLIGKQDPYIQFQYLGKKVRTEVKDEAGLHAEWNERFCLTQIDQQIHSGKRFMLEAYDKDIASDDFLGKTKGISYVYLTQDEEQHKHEMKLYDKDGKEAGKLIVTTRFIIKPPEPEPNIEINRNCSLILKIVDVSTFKDHDTFGKQDPYIKFMFDNETYQTKVADDAGTYALFNEEFELRNLMEPLKMLEAIIFQAYDKDTLTSDLMG